MKRLARPAGISRLNWGPCVCVCGCHSALKLTHRALGRRYQISACRPHCMAANDMADGFPQCEEAQRSKAECTIWRPQSLYDLILDGPSHSFCHVVLTGRESIHRVQIQGLRMTRGPEYKEMGITGATLQAAFHTL